MFAALKLGAIPVNANYRYTEQELSSLLEDADADALGGALAGNVAHAAEHVSTLRLLVRVGDLPAGGPSGPQAPTLEDVLAVTAPRPATPRPGTDRLWCATASAGRGSRAVG